MAAFPKYSFLHVTAATSLPVKVGPGTLGGVCVNKALVGTVTIKDGTSTVAVLTNGTTAPLGNTLNGPMSFGALNISCSASTEDITIFYE